MTSSRKIWNTWFNVQNPNASFVDDVFFFSDVAIDYFLGGPLQYVY